MMPPAPEHTSDPNTEVEYLLQYRVVKFDGGYWEDDCLIYSQKADVMANLVSVRTNARARNDSTEWRAIRRTTEVLA